MTQPIIIDNHGTLRFKKNTVVEYLLDHSGIDMNHLEKQARFHNRFTQEDREQFAQLIGYSINGYAELPYVSDKAYRQARAEADHITHPKSTPP